MKLSNSYKIIAFSVLTVLAVLRLQESLASRFLPEEQKTLLEIASEGSIDSDALVGSSLDYGVYAGVSFDDGQIGLVRLVTANINSGQFSGEVLVEMLNGELVKESFLTGEKNTFTLKDGTKKSGRIVVAGISIAKLPNGTFLPIRLQDASVLDARVDGLVKAKFFDNGFNLAAIVNKGTVSQSVVVESPTNMPKEERVLAQLALFETNIKYNPEAYLESDASSSSRFNSNSRVLSATSDIAQVVILPEGAFSPKYSLGTYSAEGSTQFTDEQVAALVKQELPKAIELLQFDTPVVASEIGVGGITTTEILDRTIQSIDIALGSITSNLFANNSVTSIAIDNNTVTSDDIANSTIKSEDVSENTLGSRELSDSLNFSFGDLLDLSAIDHSDSSSQGFVLPNTDSTPVSPVSGEGYIAWDADNNQIVVYDGSSWTGVSGSGSGDITDVLAGNGLSGGATSGSATLAIALTSSGTTGSTSSNSGLEVSGSGLSLLKGCNDNEILKWTDASGWACATDVSGSGSATIQESDVTIVSAASSLDFLGTDFTLTESPSGEANIAIDYASSGITRVAQNESISGAWTFTNGITVSSGSVTLPAGSIANSSLTNSSITFAGDTGSSATSLGGTRTIAGGTNGIDTSESTGTITLNLDATEIGTTTFGSGSAMTWTFDASAGTDTSIAFGNNTQTFTSGTINISDGTNTLWTFGDGGQFGTLATTIGSAGGSASVLSATSNASSGAYSGNLIDLVLDSSSANGFTGNGININIDDSQVNGFAIRVENDSDVALFAVTDDGNTTIQNAFNEGGTFSGVSGGALQLQTAGYYIRNFAQGAYEFTTGQTAGTSMDFARFDLDVNAMNGTDTLRGLFLDVTNANHTGASNIFRGIDIGAITGDADATETAINIGSGWDTDIAGASWSITSAGALTVTSCTGCGGGGSTLQQAYDAGATILTDATGDVIIQVIGGATDTQFEINAASGPEIDMAIITNSGQATNTDGVDGLAINLVQGTDAASDTNSGLTINLTAGNEAGNVIRGITIADITSGASSTETGLYIGTGYDRDIEFADTAPAIVTANTGTLSFTDGTNTLLAIKDQGAYPFLNIAPKTTATDPGTCAIGDIYVNSSDATIKACTATDTWEALDGAGGGGGNTTVALVPEFPGATLTANGSATINGTLTSDLTGSSDGWRNYYQWTSSQTTLQDYTIAVRFRLPSDFASWQTSNAIQVNYVTQVTTTADNRLDVDIRNQDDTPGSSVASSNTNASSVAATWTTVTIDDSAIDDGAAPDWDAAGETAVLLLRVYSKDSNYVRIGDIILNYVSN